MIQSRMLCQARAFVRFEDRNSEESIRATTSIQFRLEGRNSELEMIFFSPFGTRVGRLHLTKDSSYWIDAKSQYDVRQHPVLGKWYRPAWWTELSFLFGIVTKENQSAVQIDEMGQARVLNFSNRRMECDYKKSGSQKNCRMELQDIFGELELRDINCSEPYET